MSCVPQFLDRQILFAVVDLWDVDNGQNRSADIRSFGLAGDQNCKTGKLCQGNMPFDRRLGSPEKCS